MKHSYEKPTMEVKEFSKFENVFTWCGWMEYPKCGQEEGEPNPDDELVSAFTGNGSGL